VQKSLSIGEYIGVSFGILKTVAARVEKNLRGRNTVLLENRDVDAVLGVVQTLILPGGVDVCSILLGRVKTTTPGSWLFVVLFSRLLFPPWGFKYTFTNLEQCPHAFPSRPAS
jgi:hypothetical protein